MISGNDWRSLEDMKSVGERNGISEHRLFGILKIHQIVKRIMTLSQYKIERLQTCKAGNTTSSTFYTGD